MISGQLAVSVLAVGLSTSVLAAKHRMFVGNLDSPYSIHALEFDDETLSFVKTSTIKAVAAHSWIAFNVGGACCFSELRTGHDRLTHQHSQHDKTNPIQVLTIALREEGPRFLFKGWTPAFIRLGPNTVLMFVFFEVSTSAPRIPASGSQSRIAIEERVARLVPLRLSPLDDRGRALSLFAFTRITRR